MAAIDTNEITGSALLRICKQGAKAADTVKDTVKFRQNIDELVRVMRDHPFHGLAELQKFAEETEDITSILKAEAKRLGLSFSSELSAGHLRADKLKEDAETNPPQEIEESTSN